MLKIPWQIFKFLLPILFLAFPIMAAIGLFKSWEHDELVLSDRYPEYWGVLSGYVYHSPEKALAEAGYSQRSYWLLPRGLHAPKMLSLTYHPNGMVVIEADEPAFWRALFWFALFTLAFYLVWVSKWEPPL